VNAHVTLPVATAHAVYAPSAAHRWAMEGGCSASAEAIAHLGEQEEGEEAAEGTEAHDEIERVLGPLAEYGLAELDEQSREHPAAYGVALVFDYVRRLMRHNDDRVWIEQRVRLTDQIWGRCDVAHWSPQTGVLTIVDYKNGYVGVDAEENEQLRIYAAGSIYTHNLPAEWIRYAVVQPNDFRPVPRVKQWHEPAASLFAFAQRVAAIPHGQSNSSPARNAPIARCSVSARYARFAAPGWRAGRGPDDARPGDASTARAVYGVQKADRRRVQELRKRRGRKTNSRATARPT
jgi:hypothetical protein